MKYLGLDLGTKTLGIAIADTKVLIPSPLKTIKYDKRDTWNKWVVLYNVTDSNPLLPKQEVFITVNKIYDDECHISWYHDFKEHVSYDMINKFAFTKKYILKMLQDYLENYYPKNFEDKE